MRTGEGENRKLPGISPSLQGREILTIKLTNQPPIFLKSPSANDQPHPFKLPAWMPGSIPAEEPDSDRKACGCPSGHYGNINSHRVKRHAVDHDLPESIAYIG